MSTRRVAALRRYPVKAMAGESLEVLGLDLRGVDGDRWWAVHDAEGRLAACKSSRRFRRHDAVTAYAAALDPAVRDQSTQGESTRGQAGAPVVTHPDGSWTVCDLALDQHLTTTLGARVRVLPEGPVPHHDAAPVSLVGTATLAWCAERLGVDADPRRLRVNIVVETTTPFEEEAWLDEEVTVGTARLRVVRKVERCRVIDLPQDGLATGTRWLSPLAAERDRQVAVYLEVLTPGTVAVGDVVGVSAGRTGTGPVAEEPGTLPGR